ncbi:MAG: phosphatase [Alcanivorax sp.]|jgi:3',5'-nucleoside bisphosphate phosphatase|nr:MAG: phosphatase [Alcanivorax sp.]
MQNQPSSIDLHVHTTASDGELDPARLVALAADSGVSTLAITDHDSMAGLAEAGRVSAERGLSLIAGVEVSSRWSNMDIHIVGLGVNTEDERFQGRLQSQMDRRWERARIMAQRLARLGYPGMLERAAEGAPQGIPARPHFAEALVQAGACKDRKQAFQRYLAQSKPAYVKTEWPEISEAVRWIREARGVAVLAHPGRYKLTRTKLERLICMFAESGGQALEVCVATHGPEMVRQLADLAVKYNLYASQGSDYHGPSMRWVQLGKMPPLPSTCRSVLELLPLEK